MPKAPTPELKKYMEKKLVVQLNGSRQVNGTLRGYDPFMNIVLDSSVEVKRNGEQVPIGMVVIRGNSIVSMELMQRN
ncbi:MAG: putative membrane-associated protein [Piptocephalis tieghemiana]|nr:MAG: putative membrane-associated protein [Piptocephalis tieghemiana]